MDARISVTEGMIVMLEFALALGSFMSGIGLLLAPDGQFLGWTTEPLQGTPFSDYVIPALMLVAIGGILPLIVAIAALRRRAWSAWGHLVVGSLLVLWIGAQLLWIGYISLLQPIFGALGFIIAALALVAIVTTRNESRVRVESRQTVAPEGAR
jgi:hypothetical protein